MEELQFEIGCILKNFKGRKVVISTETKLQAEMLLLFPELNWDFGINRDGVYVDIYESLENGDKFITVNLDRIKDVFYIEHSNELYIYFKDDSNMNIAVA